MVHVCFITGDLIHEDDSARFTHEFDAWISSKGQELIENAQRMGELENNREWEIIYGEWYAEDESSAALWDEFFNKEDDFYA